MSIVLVPKAHIDLPEAKYRSLCKAQANIDHRQVNIDY